MKATAKTTIHIEFDREKDKDEIGAVCEFVIKCKQESKKSGFYNMFNKYDIEIIDKLITNLGIYEGTEDRRDDL